MAKNKTTCVTVKIPKGLAEKIDEMIENSSDYTGRTDVIKDSVRRRHEEIMEAKK